MVTRKTRLMSLLLAILMVVSMLTAFVLPAVAEDEFAGMPSVKEYSAENSAKDYTISTVEEWNYVGTLGTKAMSTNHTIHLTADLDFKGAAATPMNELYANIDGHGHTIKNLAMKDASLFGYYRGGTIENLTLQDCTLEKSTGTYRGFFIQMAYGATTVFRSIKMIDCTVFASSAQSGASLFVGDINDEKTLKFEDITIEGCAVKAFNSTSQNWGYAFLMAKGNESTKQQDGKTVGTGKKPTIEVNGLTMNNNTLTPTLGGNGILFGELKNCKNVTLKNIGIFNTNVSASSVSAIVGAGAVDGSFTLENALIAGNAGVTSLSSVAVKTSSHVYTDIGGDYTTAQVMSGKAAYLANQNTNAGIKKWEYLPGATHPTFDTDGAGLPFPVTVDVTDGNGGAASTATAYTTTEGKLVIPTDMILTSDANKVYTNGGTEKAAATYWPLASTVAENAASKGFIINSVAELKTAKANEGSFTNAQTLYIARDLFLGGSGFNGFGTLNASIDGGNHTLTDFTATSAFIWKFNGPSFKNLTFDNALVTSSGDSALIVFQITAATTIDNVDIIGSNLTVKGTTQRWRSGMLLAHMNADATIKNCDLADCVIYTREAVGDYSYGFVVGQNSYGHVLTLSDVTLKRCVLDATIASTSALCIGAVETGAKVNASNVLIEDCQRTAESTGGYTGGFIGLIKDGTKQQGCVVTADNITITGTTLAGKANNDSGLFLGGMYSDNTADGKPKLVASDVVILNSTQSTVTPGVLTGTGSIAIGAVGAYGASSDPTNKDKVVGKADMALNNFVMLNCTRKNAKGEWYESGELCVVRWNSTYNMKNVVLLGNTVELISGASLRYNVINAHGNTANHADTVMQNCYTDKSSFGSSPATKINVIGGMKAADYAQIAYTINSDPNFKISDTETITSTNKWEVTADGKLVLDTDGKGLPVKVVFNGVDPVGDKNYSKTLYSKVDGTLLGIDNAVLTAADWEKEVALTSTFAADETIDGDIIPDHECQMTGYTDHKNGTHTPYCVCEWDSVKGGKFGCGKVGTAVSCEATYGEWRETEGSTTEKEGTKERTCSACGYVQTGSIPKLPCLVVTAPTELVKAGEDVEVTVALKNNPGINALQFEVAFDEEKLEYVDSDDTAGLTTGPANDGKIEVAWLSAETVTGDITLVTLKFKAKDAGGKLTFTAEAIEMTNGEEILEILPVDGEAEVKVLAKHEHSFTKLTKGEGGKHMAACAHVNDGIACPETQEQTCVYDNYTAPENTVEPGVAQHTATCACGDSKVESCDTAADGYVPVEVPSTCDQTGTKTYTCKCGYTHVDDLELRKHNFKHVAGTDTHKCEYEDCGDVANCDFDVVVDEPSTEETGTKTSTCKAGCGNVKTETLPKIPYFAVTAPTEAAKPGETVTLTVAMGNNPGIAGVEAVVSFDKGLLTFKEAKLVNGDAVAALDNGDGTVTVAVAQEANITGEDAFMTLAFTVNDVEDPADAEVTITATEVVDVTGGAIQPEAGKATVLLGGLVLGDINSDGIITIGDAVLMLRIYNKDESIGNLANIKPDAADIDRNGEVELIDIIKVLQFLTGMISELK